jgi:ATP-binding cassette, subfamily B, bacterial CvaB/MchF/RaxB
MLERLDLGFARRLPVLLQTEAAECGLACLAMVAGHHDYQTDLPGMRSRFSLSLKGTTLAHLMQIAAALGLTARPLRLELEELGALRVPCILHWDLNHFVVLKSAGARGIVIHDPAQGVRKLTLAEASRHFTGVALELTPGARFEAKEERRRIRIGALMGRVSGLRGALARIFALSLCLQVFIVISPFFMQLVVDQVLVTADQDLLIALAVGFFLLVLLQTAVGVLRSWVVMVTAASLNVQWIGNVFSHLLRLPVSYFERRHIGDVVSRFGSISTIQKTLSSTFVEAILDGVMAAVTFAMMLLYSPLLSLVAVLAVLLYGALRGFTYRPLRNATEEQIVLAARQQSHFLETVRGVQSIKLFGREEDRGARFLNLVVDTTNRALRAERMGIGFHAASSLIFGVQAIAIVWLGALQVLANAFSIGMLFAFVLYKEQFTERLRALIDKWVELRMQRLQAERLADIVLAEPEERAPPAFVPSPRAGEALLEMREVHFRYADSDPWVLQGVSLKLRPGESVAIVGPSGCGKTTLLKLLLGILVPVEGEIRYRGVALRQLGVARLRQDIGSVMQEDQLFAGSIADNIAFFDPQADPARIEACARLACVHDEIVAMPTAYSTLIGDMGTAVSGGQKQRLLLARALYRQPAMLFLDEATSHLDLDRERLVNAAVRGLQMTRILIAHRPDTIRMADRVLALQGGRIVSENLNEEQPLSRRFTPVNH